MNTIKIIDALPKVFEQEPPRPSEIWRGGVVFKRGQTYIVEAASGTGKSSLCAYIFGLRNDYTGHIYFDHTDIVSIKTDHWQQLRRTSLAYLPQDLDLFDELTAIENIELKRKLTDAVSKAQVECWLEQLGIADRRDFPAGKMSIGQKQRVAIIRTLCQPFDFILLDEPVSHLDEANNLIAAQIITQRAETLGAGVVATSVGYHLQLTTSKHLYL